MRKLLLPSLVLLSASPVPAANLEAFLRSATQASSAGVVLRADGQLKSTGTGDEIDDQFVLLRSENGDTYLELRSAALRVLIRPRSNAAYQARGTGKGKAERLPMDAPIAGTDFSPEDLKPFDRAGFDSPAIADSNERQITVSFDPRDSQYTLVVITFDRKTTLPVKTMYYTETLNNLTKMRLDQDAVEVVGSWRPTAVSMQGFKLRTSSHLTLVWKAVDHVDPSRFDPAKFAQAPPIEWPGL